MAVSSVLYTHAGRMQFQGLFDCVVELEALWNPASVNSNSFTDESLPISGVRLGDMVLVSMETDLLDLTFTAHINSADNISLHLINPTAGAVDLPEAQIHVIVLRPKHHHNS